MGRLGEDLGEVGEGNRDLNLLCKVSMKNNFIEQLKSVLQYFQKVPAHGQKGCSLSTAKVLWLEGCFPTVQSINISNMKKRLDTIPPKAAILVGVFA